MTAWNHRPEPNHGAAPASQPAPAGPAAPLIAYRRAGRLPWNLLRVGLALLLIATGLFVAFLWTPASVLPGNAVAVPEDGSTHGFTLLKDTRYGFYSDDGSLSCEVTDPSGSALTVTSDATDYYSPPQVLSFRSTQAGTYSVTCSGTSAITFNTADIPSGRHRGFVLVLCSVAVGAIAGLLIVVPSTWLLVLRLRRPRPAPSTPAGGPAPGVPEPAEAPSPAGPTSASSAEPGSAPAATTPGTYGLAPQQVVYRPLPPPREPDGS